MNNAKLNTLLGMIIASSALGARGLACGPCLDSTSIIPILPANSVADAGAEDAGGAGNAPDWVAVECERQCPNSISCIETSIPQENGEALPAIECTQPGECGAGRRPNGYENNPQPDERQSVQSMQSINTWLSQAATLEAASIVAFRDLRRDLKRFGAPQRLLRAASRAAREERLHAKRTQALCRRYENQPSSSNATSVIKPAHTVSSRPFNSLEELATHNAIQGCVGETFGALIARFQGMFAKDPEIRGTMAKIAKDEQNHAALSFKIDAWAKKKLPKDAHARINNARNKALQINIRPRKSANEINAPSLHQTLGLPNPTTMLALSQKLSNALQIEAPKAQINLS